MTNNLIMQLRIQEQTLKKETTELKIKIARLINELSVYIATYYGDFEELDAEKIEQIGDELVVAKNKIVESNEKLNKIRKELN